MTDFVDPNLETLEAHGNEWAKYIEAIYAVFKEHFISSLPRRGRITIGVRPIIEDQNKERAFWHITSQGSIERERTPDLRRCERIRYPKPMIELDQAKNLFVWEKEKLMNQKRRETRLHIAVDDFSYIVVLSPVEHGSKRFLVTTFYIEYRHQREKYKKDYQEYMKKIEQI